MTEKPADPRQRETVLLGPPAGASPPPHQPPRAAGNPDRYRRVVEIAAGGMGKVFLVHDGELGRNVVMKVLHEHRKDPDSVRRFLNEARITARLEHPNIVPVYAIGEAEGQPFFTMKMVRGVDLGEVIEARRKGLVRYSLIRILQIFQGICDAVGYAHDQGVIHRDLKPENVMHGDYGEVFVMDWGLAKEIDRIGKEEAPTAPADRTAAPLLPDARREALRTQDGVVMGTPAYMPPEQARGEHDAMSTRSDIYSLGAILYEILTRQPPYQGSSPEEVLEQIKAGPPAAPRSVDPDILPPLEAICLKAMERDPQRRYAKASEISEDIQRFVEDQAVSAEHLTLWGATVRRLRRHPKALASIAVVLLLSGAWAFWEAQRDAAVRAEKAAGEKAHQAVYDLVRQGRERRDRQESAWPLLDEAHSAADPVKALPLVDQAEALAPGWAEIPLTRGRILMKAGRTAEAIEAYSEALRRQAANPVALRGRAAARKTAGDLTGARADRAAAELLAPSVSGRAFSQGEHSLRSGKASEAFDAFSEGLALTPDEPRGLKGRGEALLRLERPAEALQDLKTAVTLEPSDALARLTLASALARSGDPAGAFDEIERAWTLDPSPGERTRQALLEALGSCGEPDKALEAFLGWIDRHDRHGDLTPIQLEALLDGGIGALDARKAYAQAAILLGRLIARNPGNAQFVYDRAQHLMAAGALKEAEADCKTILGMGLQPDVLPPVHFLRARLLLGLHRPSEALDALDACERLLPRMDPRARVAQDLRELRSRIEAEAQGKP